MIFPIILFYFLFGIAEIYIWHKKGIRKEIYIYSFLYLFLIAFSFLIYIDIIPRNFSIKVLGSLIKLIR